MVRMSLNTRTNPPAIPANRNICSTLLYEANHSVMANSRRLFCLVVPAVETIAGISSRHKPKTADSDAAEKIFLVICQFRHVVAGSACGNHEWQQVFLTRMRSA